MFLEFNNIDYVHFYDKETYIYTNDKKKIKLDEIESYILMELLNEDFDIEKTNNIIIQKYNISQDDVCQLMNKFINRYSDCFIITEKKQNNNLINKIKGKYGCSYPNNVILYLTNRCYHKCKHCFKGIPAKYTDLDFQELTSFLELIKGKTMKIQLTGGEPFLYSKICELLDDYSDSFRISITSSGYEISNNIMDKLKKIYLMQISLYSCREQMNDNFMQHPGAFKKIVNNIQRLIKNGNYVRISNVITPENMDNIEEYINFCIDLGVKEITFGKIVPIGNAKENQSLLLNHDEFVKVRQELSDLKEKYRLYLKFDDWNEEVSKVNPAKLFSCDAGNLSWTVLESGDIQPCSLVNSPVLSMGNLNMKTYRDLILNNGILTLNHSWNTHISTEYRQQLHQICSSITYKEGVI